MLSSNLENTETKEETKVNPEETPIERLRRYQLELTPEKEKEIELRNKQVKEEEKVEREEREWSQFMRHLQKQAMRDGAPAAVMDLFAVLKGKKIEQKVVKIGLSADELARRSLEAERQLKEFNGSG